MNDRQIADTVNAVRDIAQKFGQAQQLRSRIADYLVPILRAEQPAPTAVPAAVSEGELPPLPSSLDDVRCVFRGEVEFVSPCDDYYTADQMRDYARAALKVRS